MFHTGIDTPTEEVSLTGPHKVSSEGDAYGCSSEGRLSNSFLHEIYSHSVVLTCECASPLVYILWKPFCPAPPLPNLV